MKQNKNQPIFKIALSMVAVFAVAFLFLFISSSEASISKSVNYQGLLADSTGDAVADGSYTLHLKIYTLAGGGSAIWSADPVVTTTDGVFSTMMDLSTLNFDGSSFYLGVAINSDPEMTPRKEIGSVPQAINANNLIGDGLIDITGDASILGNVGIGTAADANYALKVASGDISLVVSRGNLIIGDSGTAGVITLLDSGSVARSSIGLEDDNVWMDSGDTAYLNIRGSTYAEHTTLETGYTVNGSGANIGLGIYGDFSALNTTGDSYTALKLNITDAQAGADGNRYLMDLQVDSNSQFKVDSNGRLFASWNDNIFWGNEYTGGNGDAGNNNIGIGIYALYDLVGDARRNTVVGDSGMYELVSGDENSALGYEAGAVNVGSNSVFLGAGSGHNSIGSNQLWVGYQAGYANNYGQGDTGVGYESLYRLSPAYIATGNITAFSDNGGGGTTVSTNNVPSDGTEVVITGTTNFDGVWSTYNGDADSFDIGITYVSGNASGNWYQLTLSANTALGYQAGYSNTTGSSNFFGGYQAGYANTTGSSNVFIGMSVASRNTSPGEGYQNIAIGNRTAESGFASGSMRNILMGHSAGSERMEGTHNIGLGTYSLGGWENGIPVSGSNNVALGNEALGQLTTGGNNIAIGRNAGVRNTTGGSNIFIGEYAGNENISGNSNVALGNSVFNQNIFGDNNIVFGLSALGSSQYSSNQIAIGANALGSFVNQSGSITAFADAGGGEVQATSTGHTLQVGNLITIIGTTNYDGDYIVNTVGVDDFTITATWVSDDATGTWFRRDQGFNTALGYQAGSQTTVGSYNNFIGYEAGLNNTTGSNNFFGGYQAGYLNTTGYGNVFTGYQTGYSNIDGWNNVFSGNHAGYFNTSGGNDIFLGHNSGYANVNGSNNVFLGNHSGYDNIGGAKNFYFGEEAGGGNVYGSDNIAIGQTALNFTTQARGRGAIIEGFGGYAGFVQIDATADHNFIGGETIVLSDYSTAFSDCGTVDDYHGQYCSVTSIVDSDSFTTDCSYTVDDAEVMFIRTDTDEGMRNIAMGTDAGRENMYGSDNLLLGYGAGRGTGGISNYSQNVFLGNYAGDSNTTGSNNFFGGYQTGYSNTTGSENTFTGYLAGYANTTGDYNLFSGSYAGSENTTGDRNINLGAYAGGYNKTGRQNTLVGYSAGYDNVSGSQNSVFGRSAGGSSLGSDNALFGFYAGRSSLGSGLTFFGARSGQNNQYGIGDTGIGDESLYSLAPDHSGTGAITAFADNVGVFTTVTSVGHGLSDGQELVINYTTNYNGVWIISNATADTFDITLAFVADDATGNWYILTPTNNTALGYQSGYSNTTGSNNFFGGYQAGYYNTTGSNNIYIGSSGTGGGGGGSDNIAIGNYTSFGADWASSRLAIGSYLSQDGNVGLTRLGRISNSWHPAEYTLDIASAGSILGNIEYYGNGGNLNDLSHNGIYTGDSTRRYWVEIDGTGSPNTFRWSDDNGSTWTSGVAITGLEQMLSNGVGITFGNLTGHVMGEYWTFVGTSGDPLAVRDSSDNILMRILQNGNMEVAGNILPNTDDTYDLGSSSNRWRDLYLGPASLHIGTDGNESVISYNTTTNQLEMDGLNLGQLSTDSLTVSSGNLLTGTVGFNNYLNLSGGLGTAGELRLTNTGNLTNIGSIQAGEMNLTRGGTFAAKVDYTTGTLPSSIAIGDLNGDGKGELAVTNSGSNTVSVFINNDNGIFAAKTDYTTGLSPYSAVIGDLNGDGKADLTVADRNAATVSVFLNNGDGTFATKVDYATGPSPSGVVVGDFNGDGKFDLAVTSSDDVVSVLTNNGDGTFATRVDYATGVNPFSVSTADLNGDSEMDLVVSNYSSNTVSVLLNNGNGTFATKVDYAAGTSPHGAAIEDFDGDDRADIAVVNANSPAVSILINNGNGTFAAKVDYTTGSSPNGVAAGDLNGDGKPDLATANQGSDSTSVLLNNGNGTFASKVDYATGIDPYQIAIGDLNGDGKSDLAVANSGGDTVSVLLNQPQTMLFAQASTGNVGIGNDAPSALLDLQLSGTAKSNNTLLELTNSTNAADMDGTLSSIIFNQYYYDASTPAVADSGLISFGTETDWTSTASTQDSYLSFSTALDGTLGEKMRITSGGNVGIGITPSYPLDVIGSINTTGSYLTNGADYAEYFETTDTDLTSGEAVCIDPIKENAVKRCTRSADNNLMGIISSNPSIVGNSADNRENDKNYKIVAMLGQIKGNVSSENGNINIGDNLTSSSIPGYLRKANAEESTVGIALQSFSQDKGSIQILISRRNKSLTVEKVEEAVSKRIADMNVEDQVNVLIAQAKNELDQASEVRFTNMESLMATLQEQLTQLKNQINSSSELSLLTSQVDLNTEDSTFVKLLLGTDRVENIEDVDILGKLSAKTLSTGGIEIVVLDTKAPTIGTATILPADDTNDGMSVVVKTGAVTKDSKVFATPNKPAKVGVTSIQDGEGFTIETDEIVTENLEVNWWIIESN